MSFGLLLVFHVESTQNLKLNLSLEPEGETVHILLAMIGYKS